MFYANERVALIIDGVSLNNIARSLHIDIDFRKLKDIFAKKSRLMQARYYTTLFESEESSQIKPLIDWLDYNGFTITTKAARSFVDSEGRKKIKGTMNVEMAIDAISMADNIDHLVILSGDSELRAAVEAVQNKGVRVSVCSSLKSNPPVISDDLRRQADNFIDIVDIQDTIARHRKSG